MLSRQVRCIKRLKCWKGLTYAYMRDYIIFHSTQEEEAAAVAEFNEMLLISRCHSKANRYPAIKKWFLAKHPEVAEFGMSAPAAEESSDTQSSKIIPMPQNNTELPTAAGMN